jgi:TIR domain/Carboxypeptidase regulatory-like domain
MRYDVFISYSRQDSEAVEPLVAALRGRGYRVFFDKASIQVGEQWKARLGKAVQGARVCILCWSEHARGSEFVSFEYARAEGLGRPVLPWLLDGTPLPQMIEIHGVVERDAAKAAELFAPRLGMKLAARRRFGGLAAVLLLAALGFAYWRAHLPPAPWDFAGRVIDSDTKAPIAGVEVDADEGRYRAFTNANGEYVLHLPAPRAKYVDVVFSKQGYEGEAPVSVPSDARFNTDMKKMQ